MPRFDALLWYSAFISTISPLLTAYSFLLIGHAFLSHPNTRGRQRIHCCKSHQSCMVWILHTGMPCLPYMEKHGLPHWSHTLWLLFGDLKEPQNCRTFRPGFSDIFVNRMHFWLCIAQWVHAQLPQFFHASLLYLVYQLCSTFRTMIWAQLTVIVDRCNLVSAERTLNVIVGIMSLVMDIYSIHKSLL